MLIFQTSYEGRKINMSMGEGGAICSFGHGGDWDNTVRLSLTQYCLLICNLSQTAKFASLIATIMRRDWVGLAVARDALRMRKSSQ